MGAALEPCCASPKVPEITIQCRGKGVTFDLQLNDIFAEKGKAKTTSAKDLYEVTAPPAASCPGFVADAMHDIPEEQNVTTRLLPVPLRAAGLARTTAEAHCKRDSGAAIPIRSAPAADNDAHSQRTFHMQGTEDELVSDLAGARILQAKSFSIAEKSEEEKVLEAELQEVLNEYNDLSLILGSYSLTPVTPWSPLQGSTTAEKLKAAKRKLGILTRKLEQLPAEF